LQLIAGSHGTGVNRGWRWVSKGDPI
jgi:hypothetical protein